MHQREAYSFKIYGIVQGVNFRYSAMLKATELGVSGWIRNRTDGGVEGFVEGKSDVVKQFIEWLRVGPRAARVNNIEITPEQATDIEGFTIKSNI